MSAAAYTSSRTLSDAERRALERRAKAAHKLLGRLDADERVLLLGAVVWPEDYQLAAGYLEEHADD